MLTVVPCNTQPDPSDLALSRHFARVAEMARSDGDWRMAQAFISLAYMTSEKALTGHDLFQLQQTWLSTALERGGTMTAASG